MIYGTDTIQMSIDQQLINSLDESTIEGILEKEEKLYTPGFIVGSIGNGLVSQIATILNAKTIMKHIQNNDPDGICELYKPILKRLDSKSNEFTKAQSMIRHHTKILFIDVQNVIYWYGQGKDKGLLFDPACKVLKTIYRCESIRPQEANYIITCARVRKGYLQKYSGEKKAEEATKLLQKHVEISEKFIEERKK